MTTKSRRSPHLRAMKVAIDRRVSQDAPIPQIA
jgi:hypothetical protein